MTDGHRRPESAHAARFYLDDWYVDTGTNRLRKGETEVRLESKVMAVLNYLAQNNGELVTREDLEQAIWGKSIVGYDALTRCIAKLRKALDDDPRQPRYIETISKKGYRLIAQITGEESRNMSDTIGLDESLPAAGPHTTRFAVMLVAALIVFGALVMIMQQQIKDDVGNQFSEHGTALPSIVVLPFANLGDDPAQHYFSDGVTADITTALSKLSGLFVISRTSANRYREQPFNIKEVAGSLGARYVLEGSVRRSGDRIRVNVQLIDANSNVYLWSEKYDREFRDVFSVQDDIVSNIVGALSVKLTEKERQRIARKFTTSIEAYDDFLKGQSLYMQFNRERNLQARMFYQRAIDRDDLFSRAYSAMALTHVVEQRYGWVPENSGVQLDKALDLVQKAVSLNDDLPQAYWALGYVQLFRRDYSKAFVAASRAVELDPNYADSYLILAVCEIHAGKPENAVRLTRKAMLLNPEFPAAYASVLGQAYYYMGQYEQASSILRNAAERNVNLLTAHVFLIASLSKQDRLEEASWAASELKSVATDFTSSKAMRLLSVNDADSMNDIRVHLQRAGL